MYLVSTGESIFQLIVVIAIFIGVLVITYYATRWIAGYQRAMNVGKNFEVIEIQKVAGNHYVMLLRAGSGRYLIVGVGKEELTLLGELSPDEVVLSEPTTMDTYGFKDSFREIFDRFRSDKDDK
ncbi:MAG: flagellar biosynthetic protein FliO [Lachnospiraceae bacterium]|nr:flagellar biosynthetic protein FliO [Lachnospiraceae bacterium]